MDRCDLRIAIDGPAGCGKGTVGFLLAEHFKYRFLDTGAMYRVVALMALRANSPLDDNASIGIMAEQALIDFKRNSDTGGEPYKTYLNGDDVSDDIRSPEVDVASSKVAALPKVREVLVKKQIMIARFGRIVMEGRDISTVVMPDADVKIFLTASVEERARRRYIQRLSKGLDANLDELVNELVERDRRDKGREIAPLTIAPDAIVFDSTQFSIEETVKQLEIMIRNQFPCI